MGKIANPEMWKELFLVYEKQGQEFITTLFSNIRIQGHAYQGSHSSSVCSTRVGMKGEGMLVKFIISVFWILPLF